HVVADIERIADHIVLLADGTVRLPGDGEMLLASPRLLTRAGRARERHRGRQMTVLARISAPVVDPSWSVDRIGLEELLLAYMAPDRLPKPTTKEKRRLRWHG